MQSYNNNFSDMSLTELNLVLNKIKQNHDQIKNDIVSNYDDYIELKTKIDQNLDLLKKTENDYVKIIEEITKRT